MISTVSEFVHKAYACGASDVHFSAGKRPKFRLNGNLVAADPDFLTPEMCDDYALQILGHERYAAMGFKGEIDLSKEFEGVRCRINVYRQQGTTAIALRLLMDKIPEFEELKLPPIMQTFADMKRGMVLITGETGTGKSTTMAAVINKINRTRPVHIVTLEDPVEYVFKSDVAQIDQREIEIDTENFDTAMRSVLRQDPDVIFIGELRDMVTMENAMRAAETGHLVFGTLHTRTAADTVDRIVDVFPAVQQAQVRQLLAASLNAVVTQQLVPTMDGGRIMAAEIMMMTPAIRTLIRDGKSHQIDNAILTSASEGNISMDNYLINLSRTSVISKNQCVAFAHDQDYVRRKLFG